MSEIPLLSAFGTYPNPLQITNADRLQHMHAVVKIPNELVIADFTRPSKEAHYLATEKERLEHRVKQHTSTSQQRADSIASNPATVVSIGRYDEDRVGMYTSPLFGSSDESDTTRRSLHVGIDLGGTVGTPVNACCNGTVHAAGYNPELGDYGWVIVLKHCIENERVFYSLYGHLDARVQTYTTGDFVSGGQVLAGMGDIGDNGGWTMPHVHFQIAIQAPATHDMPGAVRLKDRQQALVDYPDPRYVLGELY
jgi:murein DD-endopeptidase MepM/ murein hydrolase activator NlpD